ncbi:hypothetical protein BH10PSE2_BH10PSE2_15540 [soil metagenome]
MTERRPGKPLLEDAIWIALLERYVQGETRTVLALDYGVSVEAISWQARNRGYRKMDRPDAVYRWRQPPPIAAYERRAEDLAFDYDPADPEGSAARALEQSARAAQEGRIEDHLKLNEAARSALRTGRVMRAGASGVESPSTPPVSPSPFHGEETAPLVLRGSQRPPARGADGSDWSTWLFLGGRGAGKTLAGASWISDMADRCGRLALIGATLHDAREVMIGGPSGISSLPRWRARGEWPVYQASRRRLVFPNGAEAFVFSAEDPDSLRGPQFAAAWADEFCAWRDGGETLALLRMGLRLTGSGAPGTNARDAVARCLSAPDEGQAAEGRWIPRLVVTTTPRPTQALRALRAEASCVQTHAPTKDNAANLAPAFLDGLEALYGGTRRAAQELDGLVVEPEGGLFTALMIAGARDHAGDDRASDDLSAFDKVVVAVDPTTTAGGNACGIVVVARIGDRAVVLADRSAAGLSPEGWARRALAAAAEFGASEIVAEVNQGGEMVKSVLDAVGFRASGLGWRPVRATQGKRARAEPVAALYEQGRVRHAGTFAALEEELMAIGGEEEARFDLDRADALVWGVTALLLGGRGQGPRIRSLDVTRSSWGVSNPNPWPDPPVGMRL